MYELHCMNTMLRAEEVRGELEASKPLRSQMANAGENLSMTERMFGHVRGESLCLLQSGNQTITLMHGILLQREILVAT